MSRDYFLFFANFREMAKKMSPDMRLKFYDAMTDYVFDGLEPDDETMGIILTAIKPSLDKVSARGGNRDGAGAPENNQNAKKQSKQKDKINKTIKNNQKQSNNQNNQSFLEEETETETEAEEEDMGVKTQSHFDLPSLNAVLAKHGLPQIAKLNDDRKAKLKQRVAEAGSFQNFVEEVDRALASSSFLRGDNNRGWRADFDFFLQKSKWQKVVEGCYRDRDCKKTDDEFYRKLEEL